MRTGLPSTLLLSTLLAISCAKPSPQKITPAEARQQILDVYHSRDQGFEAQSLDGVFHHDDKALITDAAAKNLYSTFYHGSDFKSSTQIVKADFTATGATVVSTCTQSYNLMNCTWNSAQGIKEPFIDSYRDIDTWVPRSDGWWMTNSHEIIETHMRNGQPFNPPQ